MRVLENKQPVESRLKAFVAFAFVISLTNNYLCRSFWIPPTPTAQETLPVQPQRQHSPPSTFEKPILFVHFHKSSGTSACEAMKKSINITNAEGKQIERQKTKAQHDLMANCNTPFSGPNANVRLFLSLQSCRHLLPYALDEEFKPRINLVAVEVPFRDSMPCPGFRSFAIMRDPVTRLQSHIAAYNWKQSYITGIIRKRVPVPDNYYMDGYSIVNSMVIRQLLGRERYVDVRPVDEEDLEKAKHIVDQFNAFVPMEYLNHPNVQELLNKTIPEYLQEEQKRTTPRKQNAYTPSQAFLQLISDENKYDTLLYQYMLEKLGIRTVQ